MTTSLSRTKALYGHTLGTAELTQRMSPSVKKEDVSINKDMSVEQRWRAIEGQRRVHRTALFSAEENDQWESGTYSKNIENFVGFVKLPVGIAGPLRVNGSYAKGDYLVPMATTEAALVASTARGSRLITLSGGATAFVCDEGVTRVPLFEFESLVQVQQFLRWLLDNETRLHEVAQSTSHHAQLIDLKTLIEGNRVHLRCEFRTGNASGQNMVTFAASALTKWIQEHCPIPISRSINESGGSSDKKPSALSFLTVRGRRVVADVTIPAELCRSVLGASPADMVRHRTTAFATHAMIQTIGSTFHCANVLAAVYLACGQDPACVAESHAALSRFSLTNNGDLYACITLPAILCGTVGGGTQLPSQRAALDILGLGPTDGSANALAEIVACACLAAELSICGAFVKGDFAKAHLTLSRKSEEASKLLSKL